MPPQRIARQRIHTLRQFVDVLETTPTSSLKEHVLRHDLSRWVADVFGDYPLAERVREIETAFRRGDCPDPFEDMAQAVRSRYEFVDTTLGPL